MQAIAALQPDMYVALADEVRRMCCQQMQRSSFVQDEILAHCPLLQTVISTVCSNPTVDPVGVVHRAFTAYW